MKMLKKNEGFTLIELMIVVVIIGVLAAVAVPQFLKYQLKAKSSESTRMIGGIKTASESFASKYRCSGQPVAGCYALASESSDGTSNYGTGEKIAWGASPGLMLIGFSASGLVYFGYSVASAAGISVGAAGTTCNVAPGAADATIGINTTTGVPEVATNGVPPDDGDPTTALVDVISWMARGDVDGDGIVACYQMGNVANEFINNPPDASDNVF